MPRNSAINARYAFRRPRAVSKVFWNRSRNSYSGRNRGKRWNSPSSFCFSSFVSPLGSRRNSHINDRNSFRSALDSFALYARVIFFPLAVDGLVELLGDVEAVHHRAGLGQRVPAGVVERLGHVRSVSPHLLPLRRRQFLQAFPGRRLVPPFG